MINFKINLSLLIKPFLYMTKNLGQEFKYLKNEKSFKIKLRSLFITFKGLSLKQIKPTCQKRYCRDTRNSPIASQSSLRKFSQSEWISIYSKPYIPILIMKQKKFKIKNVIKHAKSDNTTHREKLCFTQFSTRIY